MSSGLLQQAATAGDGDADPCVLRVLAVAGRCGDFNPAKRLLISIGLEGAHATLSMHGVLLGEVTTGVACR